VPKAKATFLPNYLSKLADRIVHFSPMNCAIVLERTESNRQFIKIEGTFELEREVLVLYER
jgi:hypothetical protein